MKKDRLYIWCYCGPMMISPEGNAKTMEYAKSISGKKPKAWQLFKLTKVRKPMEAK